MELVKELTNRILFERVEQGIDIVKYGKRSLAVVGKTFAEYSVKS